MDSYNFLITNDDGQESPLLMQLICKLSAQNYCSELRVVVPSTEQSWCAQSMTRFCPLYAQKWDISEVKAWTVNGTPADCASLGITQLFNNKPDFVISGINLGHNAGLPYYLNSGTIGAARQAFLHEVKAIAFSLQCPTSVYDAWYARDSKAMNKFQDDFIRIADICTDITKLLITPKIWKDISIFSVNIPWTANTNSKPVLTYPALYSYGSLFHKKSDGSYVHRCEGYKNGKVEDDVDKHTALTSDVQALSENLISISPISYNFKTSLNTNKALFNSLLTTINHF